VALIDIKKAKHPSNIWSYFGLAPNQKRKRGEKVNYNPLAKTIVWKIADCFIKTKSPYRKIYDERKKYEQEKHPELTKGHIDMRARRYMVKEIFS
jgi:protein subunit release factor B